MMTNSDSGRAGHFSRFLLGIDIDEDVAATFPYQRAYLPVNRLLDGTMHDW